MKPCLAHGQSNCALCKCASHREIDCEAPQCLSYKQTYLHQETSHASVFSQSAQGKPSLTYSKRPINKTEPVSDTSTMNPAHGTSDNISVSVQPQTTLTHSAPADSRLTSNVNLPENNLLDAANAMIDFLKKQNTQLMAQVEQLSAQLKNVSEQLTLLTQSQAQVQAFQLGTPSPRRKKTKFPKVPSLAATQLFADQNRFNALVNDDVTDEEMDILEGDLSLGSDDEVFILPNKNANPEINKALGKLRRTKQQQQQQHQPKASKKGEKLNNSTLDNKTNACNKDINTNDSSNATESNVKTIKPKKPPPIVTAIETNFTNLCKVLSIFDKKLWTSKAMQNDSFRINAEDDVTHFQIIEALEKANIHFNTYENKNVRPIRTIVKGLHHLIPIDDIVTSLKEQGHNPVYVKKSFKKVQVPNPALEANLVNKTVAHNLNASESVPTSEKNNKPVNSAETTSPQTELESNPNEQTNETQSQPAPKLQTTINQLVPINEFQIGFEHGDSMEKIFQIKTIANVRVSVVPVPPNDPKIPVQCRKCQSFLHTTNFCYFPPKCVKCGEGHLTHLCSKPKWLDEPKCANCMQKHPANYLGCPVAKIISSQRKEILKKKISEKTDIRTRKQVQPAKSTLKPGTSFSDAFKNIQENSRNFPDLPNKKGNQSKDLNNQINNDEREKDNYNLQNNTTNNFVQPDMVSMMNQLMLTIGNLCDRMSRMENTVASFMNQPGPSNRINGRS